ncbi:MAG: hypothetical protein NVSMB17_12190 [Candidatus Dormibacteria bacterium]
MVRVGPILYLYVGSDDIDADLRFLVDGLGGELAWRFHEYNADVAGVRMGDGPMYIVAAWLIDRPACLAPTATVSKRLMEAYRYAGAAVRMGVQPDGGTQWDA